MGTIGPGRPEKYSPATANATIPPSQPGLYRIRNRTTGKVEYIGETGNIYRRLLEHVRSGKYDPDSHEIEWKCADLTSTSAARREIEKRWILRHNPTSNENAGGGGRPVRQPSSELPVEVAPVATPESASGWKRVGRDLALRLRETAGALGSEFKEELVAHVKESLRAWFEDQRDRFIERSKRKLRNMIFPPEPPADIGRLVEEAPPDAIVEIAYRDDLLPFLDTIPAYTPEGQLKEGWAAATIMGRPVRVVLPPSVCTALLGYTEETEQIRPTTAMDVLREAHFGDIEEAERLRQLEKRTTDTQENE